MTAKIVVVGMLLVLTACKTAEDRQWSDMQTILGITQPKKQP